MDFNFDVYTRQLEQLTHDIRQLIKLGYNKQQLSDIIDTAHRLKQRIKEFIREQNEPEDEEELYGAFRYTLEEDFNVREGESRFKKAVTRYIIHMDTHTEDYVHDVLRLRQYLITIFNNAFDKYKTFKFTWQLSFLVESSDGQLKREEHYQPIKFATRVLNKHEIPRCVFVYC
jgi:cysteinyl-tRNA synthetase